MKTYLVAINESNFDPEGITLTYFGYYGGLASGQYNEPFLDEDVIDEIVAQNGIDKDDLYYNAEDAFIEFFQEGYPGGDYTDSLNDLFGEYVERIKSVLEGVKVPYRYVDAEEYIDSEIPYTDAFAYKCGKKKAEEISQQLSSLRKSYLKDAEDLGVADLIDSKYRLKIGGAKIDLNLIDMIIDEEIEGIGIKKNEPKKNIKSYEMTFSTDIPNLATSINKRLYSGGSMSDFGVDTLEDFYNDHLSDRLLETSSFKNFCDDLRQDIIKVSIDGLAVQGLTDDANYENYKNEIINDVEKRLVNEGLARTMVQFEGTAIIDAINNQAEFDYEDLYNQIESNEANFRNKLHDIFGSDLVELKASRRDGLSRDYSTNTVYHSLKLTNINQDQVDAVKNEIDRLRAANSELCDEILDKLSSSFSDLEVEFPLKTHATVIAMKFRSGDAWAKIPYSDFEDLINSKVYTAKLDEIIPVEPSSNDWEISDFSGFEYRDGLKLYCRLDEFLDHINKKEDD